MSTATPEEKKEIYAFLAAHRSGVLSTVNDQNQPHGSVVYFAVEDDDSFTFTTKHDTAKHEHLSKNPNVSLVVYDAASQTTVEISATAAEITDEHEAYLAFSKTVDASWKVSEAGVPPISKVNAGAYVAYRLTPSLIRRATFKDKTTGDRNIFQVIEF